MAPAKLTVKPAAKLTTAILKNKMPVTKIPAPAPKNPAPVP